MICCCSLAGTKACENCNNRQQILGDNHITPYKSNWFPMEHSIEDILNNSFIGDLVRNKKGYWIEEPNENANNRLEWRCSNCNEYADWTYDYCPNCGAKMENT